MQSHTFFRAALLATVTVCFAAEDAFAQIEEILVTVRKREESLQDIPLSITAFDSAALERNRIENIIDVAKLTPSLVFDEGFVPQDTRPQIRGLPATRGRPPVGILIDGIDVSSESMLTAGGGMLANLRLLDTERIEVVKGPQSALYGRVAFGGAINYISKKPGDEFEGNFSADMGDYGQVELKASASGPVSDTISIGVNAAFAEHDGYYENALDGKRLGGYKSVGGAVSARFTPSDRVTDYLRISYSEDEYGPRAQTLNSLSTNRSTTLPLPANAVGLLVPGAFGPTPLPANVFVPIPGKITSSGPVLLSKDALTGLPFEGSTLDSLVISNILEWEFDNNISLTSWTGYTRAEFRQNQDVDFFGAAPGFALLPAPPSFFAEPLPFLFQFDLDTTTKQFNQEIRVGDLESDGLRWAIGGQFWREDVSQKNNNLISLMFGLPGLPPSAAHNISLVDPAPVSDEFRDTEHWSVYGILEYDLTDRFTASVEARYSDEQLDVGWIVGGRGAVGFVAPVPGLNQPIPINVGTFEVRDASDDFFTPKFTLEYQATDDALLYASVSKGVKPGGISTIAGTSPDNGRFFPEKLWSYEIGAKTAWVDNMLVLNAAGFYMDYKGKQVTLLEPNPDNVQGNDLVVRNAGEAEVYGVEIDAVISPTEEFSFSIGYAYLDTEYTDFILTTTGALNIATGGNCTPFDLPGGTQSCSVDFSGGRLERIPKNALTLAGSYRTPISNDLDLVADLSAQYQSKRFSASAGLHFYGAFWNVDGRIGVDAGQWSLFLYGENILNDKTVRSGQSSGDFSALGNLAIITFEPPKPQGGIRYNYRF